MEENFIYLKRGKWKSFIKNEIKLENNDDYRRYNLLSEN